MAQMKFKLSFDDVTYVDAYPYYKELKIKYKQESREAFFREEIDGKVKFLQADFDKILAQPFDTIYYLNIFITAEDGATKQIKTKFTRTKCKIDIDNRILETKLEVADQYGHILEAMDKEYDLLRIGAIAEKISLYKRPVIQCYIPGEKFISSYIDGVYWETECEPVSDINELHNDYAFDTIETPTIDYMWTTDTKDGTIENNAQRIDTVKDGYLYSDDMRFRLNILSRALQYKIYPMFNWSNATEVETIDGVYCYEYTHLTRKRYARIVIAYKRKLAFRLLCDNKADAKIRGEDASGPFTGIFIKNDGSFGNTMNYKYAIKINPESYGIVPILNVYCSDKEGRYGQRQPGQFYRYPVLPTQVGFSSVWPACKNTWGDVSIWFSYSALNEAVDAKYRLPITIRHAYSLGSCIRALLKKAAPNIKFEDAPDFSKFFFDGTYFDYHKLFLMPKSNAIKGNYDQPAQKMPITLKKLFDMLKNCFKCYWYIDNDKLRLEHIYYFSHGESYTDTTPIDITTTINVRTDKPWSFGTNNFEFESEDMPERIQFGWADDSSEPFDGTPLEVLSNYVKKGQVDEVSVNGFSTDVDMMMSTPSDFSQDGIAMMVTDSINTVPYFETTIRIVDYFQNGNENIIDEVYRVQNGFLGFANLVPCYYCSDLPGSRVKINGIEYTGGPITSSKTPFMIKRAKKQKLKCPIDLALNPYDLYTTELGTGQIKEITYDLSSEVAELTILHNTEN